MMILLLGFIIGCLLLNMAFYEYRVMKGPKQLKEISLIGWRFKE